MATCGIAGIIDSQNWALFTGLYYPGNGQYVWENYQSGIKENKMIVLKG